jgi:hypothetical protein
LCDSSHTLPTADQIFFCSGRYSPPPMISKCRSGNYSSRQEVEIDHHLALQKIHSAQKLDFLNPECNQFSSSMSSLIFLGTSQLDTRASRHHGGME